MKYNMLTFIALVAAFFASKSLLAAHHVVGHQVLICGPILNKKHNHQCLHAIGGAKAGNLVVYHKGIKRQPEKSCKYLDYYKASCQQ